HEVRDRDRQRREIAFRDGDALRLGENATGSERAGSAERGDAGNDLAAVGEKQLVAQFILVGHWSLQLGIKWCNGCVQIGRSWKTGVKDLHSSKNCAGRLYGWHWMIARNALSE